MSHRLCISQKAILHLICATSCACVIVLCSGPMAGTACELRCSECGVTFHALRWLRASRYRRKTSCAAV